MKITNIEKGPRAVNTHEGTVFLNPGETRDDLKLSAAELKAAKKTGWFDIDGAGADNDADDDEAPHQVKHAGGGKYRVVLNGEPVGELHPDKESAQKAADELNKSAS